MVYDSVVFCHFVWFCLFPRGEKSEFDQRKLKVLPDVRLRASHL